MFFNIIAILFGLFSFLFFIPFLSTLFKPEELDKLRTLGPPKELEYTMSSVTEQGKYWMSEFLATHSRFELLLLLCGIILGMIFLKNIARYFYEVNYIPCHDMFLFYVFSTR